MSEFSREEHQERLLELEREGWYLVALGLTGFIAAGLLFINTFYFYY